MGDDVKQVKVDNWGIYFLQRLKHFFNRTDYCDLTLQFQDNAQLKVHRLVLSACTEYFELLERTCEMYEDCLVMPEDLQADIVVPIVNFMYTGQLEFKMDLLERLHQCSEIMNMPVLTKLLDSHRPKAKPIQIQAPVLKKPVKHVEGVKQMIKSISATEVVTTSPITYKRSHNKAFTEKTTIYRDKKVYLPMNKSSSNGIRAYRDPSPIPLDTRYYSKKVISGDPRPTRYELPEELDSDNIFESSFTNISYTSQPLMVHPENRKQYAKRSKLNEASTSKKYGANTVDIVQCKKPNKQQGDSLFEDGTVGGEADLFTEQFTNKPGPSKDTNQLFDQILDKNVESKLTIETKNPKSPANLDHAKIISEVLKKYPHLVKSNKNIKLKILNTPSKTIVKKPKPLPAPAVKLIKSEKEVDFTFETDVLDSIQAAKLIALGADNVDGPWICLICGTPGKAMNFTSYYKFRRHLIEVHNEKPLLNLCEYCGQKSTKRNYLLHHMYTKHGVEPPAQYHFPKCSNCNYVALTEALLIKHKLSHAVIKKFRCNVCPAAFHSSAQLLAHIQNTGHKYSAERKSNFQCIYCQKNFLRETNLCAHLKTHHRLEAINDGIIDDSEEEHETKTTVKSEPIISDFQELDIQYQIQQRPDGNINIVTKTAPEQTPNTKQTILNSGLSGSALTHRNKTAKRPQTTQNEYIQDVGLTPVTGTHEEIVMIDNTEYIMRDNQLIPRRPKEITQEYILSDHGLQSVTPTTSMDYTNQENIQHANIFLKNSDNITESIPIYVSNEEEYKALMASNQPIILDSGDSNKTLTVLTNPHTSTLDTTTIDLDTTQSNDMMIIQDNFPLNVSEAVTSDNSNIVVVYSHQVAGDNKQYQLLTTQGLGAQFVQSSAIITQNFETITTTAPVNTQALEKQVEEVWQSDLQQIVNTDHIEITPVSVTEVAEEPPKEMQESNIAESNNDISELSQGDISSNIKDTTDTYMDITHTNQNQEDVITEEILPNNLDANAEVECEDSAQNGSTLEISNEGPIEHEVGTTVDLNEPANVTIGDVIDPDVDPTRATVEDAELIESQTYTEPDIESQTCAQIEPTIEPAIENMDVPEQQQSEEVLNDIQTTLTAEIETIQEGTKSVTGNHEQIMEVGMEKSQIINSEWTEDNIQDPQKDNPAEITSQVNNSIQVINLQDNIEACEVEESIENIQQEVNKMAAIHEIAEQEITDEVTTEHEITDDGDVANSSQDESDYAQENSVTVVVDPVVAQEKISSLLNDWEDNDSQEDNESANENTSSVLIENVENPTLEPTNTENPEKQDKIKSLVSDWDEEEDDNKE